MTSQPPPARSAPFPARLRGRAWVVVAGLIGLAAIFYAPIVLGLRTFPDGDFTHHFLPFSLFLQDEVLAGRLPVWNPFTYGGHPFLADVQAAVFYPVSNALLGLTLPWTAPGARLYFLQVEAIVQVALAGWFTFLLVRKLTARTDAAILAGITFAFSGYLTGYPPVQLAVLRTAIWLPLILWLLLRAVEAPRAWRRWIAAGVALAVGFLAGHSQTTLYVLYASAAWWIVLLILRRSELTVDRGWLPVLAGAVSMGLVALGLSAPQLLPSIEFAQLSVRANVDYAYVSGGFPLQDTWQALIPGVLTTYSPLYVGVVSLGLAFVAAGAALMQRRRKPPAATASTLPISLRAGVLFFGGLAFVALLLSYGGNGFLYPLFYRLAPGFNLFRGQERAAYLVALGLSVLAGYGVLAIHLLPPRLRAWLATLFAGLVVGAVYLFGMLWQLPGRSAIGQWHYLLIATITITLAATFAVMLRWPGWSVRRTWLLGALIFANLLWANGATNVADFGPARKVIMPPEVDALQSAVAETTGANVGLAGRAYNEFRAYEDYGMRAGVEDVWGSSPLRLARYARLFDEFPLDRLWQLTGVDHVLTWRRELFVPSTLLAEFPQATDTTYLHRLSTPNPRAWVVGSIVSAPDDAAATLLADHTVDLRSTAVLPADIFKAPGDPATATRVDAAASLTLRAPGHYAVTVDSPAAGLLVVSENWMPGWRVVGPRCGAEQAACAPGTWPEGGDLALLEPLRANLAFLGIPVPAGLVRFDLVYAPDSVRTGLWIGGVTLLFVLGSGVLFLWRRRRTAA
ncbi:MAG: hypothetical protein H6640_16485 [Caldilineaceae bacterium]|nr:hypothetical protein [Caldilineaceae bacterium]